MQQLHYHVHDEDKVVEEHDNIHTRNVVIALGLGLKHSLIVSPVSSEFMAMDKCSIISHEARASPTGFSVPLRDIGEASSTRGHGEYVELHEAQKELSNHLHLASSRDATRALCSQCPSLNEVIAPPKTNARCELSIHKPLKVGESHIPSESMSIPKGGTDGRERSS